MPLSTHGSTPAVNLFACFNQAGTSRSSDGEERSLCETGCRRLVVDTAVHGDLENNPFRNSQLMEDDECIRDVVRSTETEYRSHTYGK